MLEVEAADAERGWRLHRQLGNCAGSAAQEITHDNRVTAQVDRLDLGYHQGIGGGARYGRAIKEPLVANGGRATHIHSEGRVQACQSAQVLRTGLEYRRTSGSAEKALADRDIIQIPARAAETVGRIGGEAPFELHVLASGCGREVNDSR